MMADFGRPWVFCGGWAIDLFLGRQTRAHKDVDIAVGRRDQLALQAYLTARGWRLQVAHGGELRDWPAGEYLELPRHGIWCRHPAADPHFLEVLLDEIDDSFRFRRDQTVTRALDEAFVQSPGGLPILAPEVVLLYKSRSPGPDDWADFRAVLPALDAGRRDWLRNALARTVPGHPWLVDLGGPTHQDA
jgi:hypothetical protein